MFGQIRFHSNPLRLQAKSSDLAFGGGAGKRFSHVHALPAKAAGT
ncbi:MAG TPA: hypothetical protein VFQ86_10955 [Arachidicoccus soli]|nr:hypothetical protein [Arachidicoccus soli]HEU0228250.1 hypothetical protein [Arachidicoccus soli]